MWNVAATILFRELLQNERKTWISSANFGKAAVTITSSFLIYVFNIGA